MIRQVTGQVVEVEKQKVVVEVNGLGYLIYTNNTDVAIRQTDVVTFYTHLAVRETALDLYGFTTKEELEVFELLLTLPKIGPKSALQILGQADISLLQKAVTSQDSAYLTKMSGIGKKSAEKIVLGLKDKLANFGNAGDTMAEDISFNGQAHAVDTIDALISLGYPPPDARRIVIEIIEANPTLSSSSEAIKIALRQLGK